MAIRFVAIDDDLAHVATVVELLKGLSWPDAKVWPNETIRPEQKKTRSWKDAWETVLTLQDEGWDPKTSCCVLILDIALGDQADSIAEGVDAIRQYRNNPVFENYVWVIWTRYDESVMHKLADMDAIIQKEHLTSRLVQTAQARQNLEDNLLIAIQKWAERTGRGNPVAAQRREVRVVDSPSMRLFKAALGGEAINRLVSQVAKGWGPTAVDALSGGYSGAFLIRLAEVGGNRQVVCKVAREEGLIRDEAARWKELVSYPVYTRFAAHMLEPEPLGGTRNAYFVREASINGGTLEQLLLASDGVPLPAGSRGSVAIAAMRDVIALAATASERPTLGESQFLRLSPDDIDRFDASAKSLRRIATRCAELRLITRQMLALVEGLENFQSRVLSDWTGALKRANVGSHMLAAQHGDLNPRNILISDGATPLLIDYARFGKWPVGYDLTRLELQLVLRLLDRANAGEHFPGHLKDWWRLWRAIADETRDQLPPTFAQGDLYTCLELIADGRRQAFVNEPGLLQPLTNTLRCFDAVKMCSYQDATPFKRLFFMLVAIDCARRAGLA